jgi:hypothetical protein
MVSLLFVIPALFGLYAQESQVNRTYVTDLNGRRVADGDFTSDKSEKAFKRTEWTQSINGRRIPLESVEERIISEGESGRVVERFIRRYDANGNPGPIEKQRIEESKNSDGSVNSVTNIYRGDLNGNLQHSERLVTESSKAGDTVNARTTVERVNVSGQFEVSERQVRTVTQDQTSSQTDTTTFRKDQHGRFSEALRVVTSSNEQNGQRVENTAQYEAGQLASQTVTRERKKDDGSVFREVDLFRRVPGRAEPFASPVLEERQIIDQTKQGDRIVETTSVQRPSVNDPNRLSAPRRISERICEGANCK